MFEAIECVKLILYTEYSYRMSDLPRTAHAQKFSNFAFFQKEGSFLDQSLSNGERFYLQQMQVTPPLSNSAPLTQFSRST